MCFLEHRRTRNFLICRQIFGQDYKRFNMTIAHGYSFADLAGTVTDNSDQE